MEPIRSEIEGEESVNPVRSMESRGTCKTQAKAVEMGVQGAWTTWNTADRKLTW